MARVLVTGANGYIGANTVRSLLHKGHEVIPLIRRGSDLRGLEGLGLAFRYGDMMDSASLVKAAQGCDVIIHLAAVVNLSSKNPDEVIQPALIGTRNIFYAAKQAGIRRLIYTSSVAAVGPSADPHQIRCEADWHPKPRNPYGIAKLKSERAALDLSYRMSVPTIRLCPTYVLGPYDYRITPTTAFVLGLINGTHRTLNGGWNIVHVRDVADAHAAAVDCGEPGQRYILGGTNLTLVEFGEIVEKVTGIEAKHFGAGRSICLLMVSIGEVGARLTGEAPLTSSSQAYEIVERYWYVNSGLAGRTFGFAPLGAEETIRDAVRWLVHLGGLKRAISEPFLAQLAPDPEWRSDSDDPHNSH